MRERFRAVVFDMDGVLFDTEVVYQGLLEKFFLANGVKLSRDVLDATVGASGLLNWENLKPHVTFADSYDEYIGAYRRFTDPYKALFNDRLNPHVCETLDTLLAQGYRLALASSTREARIHEMLDASGLTSHFDVIVSGESFKQSKPHPEIYLTTVRMLGFSPRQCAAVEDSAYGIASARSAGLFVIAKREPRFGIDQSAAACIVDDLLEIPNVLEKYMQERTDDANG